MIITREWISEFIDISQIDNKTLSNKLDFLGLEVDSIVENKTPKDVVIGKITDVSKHPNADRLNICTVDIGKKKHLQIICGSSSVKKDLLVAVAIVGARLANVTIEPIKLRSIDSFGMICSAKEIGIDMPNDDIIILDESIGVYKLGTHLSEIPIFNDTIINLDITANRGDCFNMYGVAREISASFKIPLKKIKNYDDNSNVMGIGRVLSLSNIDDCNSLLYYRIVDVKHIKSSFKINLLLSYVEKYFNSCLDKILFYASYSTGVMLNAYALKSVSLNSDMAKLKIIKDKNSFETVCSEGRELSKVGIGDFRNIDNNIDGIHIIEASYIHPELISKSVFASKIKTGSIYFNTSRGSNPDLDLGLGYFLNLLSNSSNSISYAGCSKIGKVPNKKSINVYPAQIAKIIGLDTIDKKVIDNILVNLGFDTYCVIENDYIKVDIPAFRHDISNIQDLAEEVLRSIGISNVSSKPLRLLETLPSKNSINEYSFKNGIRNKAIANSFNESMSFIFYKKELLAKYNFPTINDNIDIVNPITTDLNTLRSTIILNLIDSASLNSKNGFKQIAFFEIGYVFDKDRKSSQKLTFLFSGNIENESFTNSGKPQIISLFAFAKKISNIIGSFELENITNPTNKLLHPYKSAFIIQNSKTVGYLGRLTNDIESKYKLQDTFVCEIDFDKIDRTKPNVNTISRLQSSTRDITVLVDEGINYTDIKRTINNIKLADIKEFYLLDVYKDEKCREFSFTIRMIIQPTKQTLNDKQIDNIVSKVLLELKIDLDIRHKQ
jgi:phenylalanyl-tRNA synthetase beta chain